jgi:hypothetical protein
MAFSTPLQIVALRAESYAPQDGAVIISLRAKYSTADRKYLVPLECLHDLVLDLQRFSATAGMSAAPNLVEPHPKSEAGPRFEMSAFGGNVLQNYFECPAAQH